MGEFSPGRVRPGYRAAARRERTEALLDARMPIGVEEYRELHRRVPRDTSTDLAVDPVSAGEFHFAGISGRARRYTRD